MRKLTRTIMSATLVATLFLSPTFSVHAAESVSVDNQAVASAENLNFGTLISTETYEDEYGNTVVEQLFFRADQDVSLASESGSGTFTASKTIKWTGNSEHPTSTYFASGHFTWGNGDVSVTNAMGGISYVPSFQTLSNEKTETGHGKYLGIFNNYATVTYSFTLTDTLNMSNDYSVTVRISQSGNQI